MNYVNRMFTLVTLIIMQHAAIGFSWHVASTSNYDAKLIEPDILKEIAAYKTKAVEIFLEKQGKVTACNRDNLLNEFIKENNALDFANHTSQEVKEAIALYRKDWSDHHNRVYLKGVHDLTHLDFKKAVEWYPDNVYLQELAEISMGVESGQLLKKQILENLRVHDEDKLHEHMAIPYARVCKADIARSLFSIDKCGRALNFNDEVLKQLTGVEKAFLAHVENNPHHPEYWIKKGQRMDTASVFEMYVDGKACGSRFEAKLTLKASNEASRNPYNWGRLIDDHSCWKDLPDREAVFEALAALMALSETYHGAETTVADVMRIAQEEAMTSQTQLNESILQNKPWLVPTIIIVSATALAVVPFTVRQLLQKQKKQWAKKHRKSRKQISG